MLRKTFEMLTLNPADHGVGLIWAAVLERQYIDLLKAEEPMALVLLAHFGVALHASRKKMVVRELGLSTCQSGI
jgi:hypothetical protein